MQFGLLLQVGAKRLIKFAPKVLPFNILGYQVELMRSENGQNYERLLGTVKPAYRQLTVDLAESSSFTHFTLDHPSSARRTYNYTAITVWILDFKKDDYVTLYSCAEVEGQWGIQRNHYTWVLSKYGNMHISTFQEIESKFVNLTKLIIYELHFC